MDAEAPLDVAEASQQADPEDFATDLQPTAVEEVKDVDAVKPEVGIEAGMPGPLLPQEIPLPLSPVLVAEDTAAAMPVVDPPTTSTLPPAVAEEIVTASAPVEDPVSLPVERRPSATERLLNLVAPSTPSKSAESQVKVDVRPAAVLSSSGPPKATSPPPAGNVTNRLAGLFSKRPTTSLPKVSIPSLPSIMKPHQSPITSPSRNTGSPIQAKDSLNLARSPVKRGSSTLALPESGHVVAGSSDVSTEDLPASLDDGQRLSEGAPAEERTAEGPIEPQGEVNESSRDVRHSLDSVD
jgi:hypothetical protein